MATNTTYAKNKRISKNMLEADFKAEFEAKANTGQLGSYRRKDALIGEDDLKPSIVKQLTNLGSPGGTAYDDTGLRNRVIALENTHINKNNAFDKTKDLVGRGLLDADLKGKISMVDAHETAVTNLNNTKAEKNNVAATYRRKDVPISELDLETLLKGKINRLIAALDNVDIVAADTAAITKQLTAVNNAVAALQTSKASVTSLVDYRRKDAPIGQADLDSAMIALVTKINTALPQIARKADASALNDYRRKDAPIDMGDLTSALQSTLTKVDIAATGVVATAETVFDRKKPEVMNDIAAKYGTPDNNATTGLRPYNFAHAVCSFTGTLNTTGLFTFSDVFNYLWDSLDEALGRITACEGNISSLGGRISICESNIGTLTSRVSGIDTQVTANKNDIANMKTDIAAIKKKLGI